MKKVLFMSLAFCYFSCGQKTENTAITKDTTVVENKVEQKVEELPYVKPAGNIYRCDGFHNGIASEWMEVAFKENGEVAEIKFWTTENEDKMKVEILEQRIGGDETTAVNIGKIKFPKNPFVYEFKIQEELFALTDDDGSTQEFDYEREEF